MNKNNSSVSSRIALAPYGIWSTLFIVVPLFFVAYYAFTDNDFNFTLENIVRFFSSGTYLIIFWRSLKLAIISTIICLLIGYPFAYVMSRASDKFQSIALTLVMVPMWMNFLIRTYAWMTILQDTGLINTLLSLIHLPNVHIIGTETAVVIGMVYDYLPYMILPIYSVMAKMDEKLLEAASDLGCDNFATIKRVVLPLSMPGVISGITMVLIPSISTFYISQKLGSGKFYLIGDAIEGQYVANNLHFAAAIAFILMVILLIGMSIMRKYADRSTYVEATV